MTTEYEPYTEEQLEKLRQNVDPDGRWGEESLSNHLRRMLATIDVERRNKKAVYGELDAKQVRLMAVLDELLTERAARVAAETAWARFQDEAIDARNELAIERARAEAAEKKRDALARRECCTNCGRWDDEPTLAGGFCAEFPHQHPCNMLRREWIIQVLKAERRAREEAEGSAQGFKSAVRQLSAEVMRLSKGTP